MERRRTTVRDVRRANRASLLTELFHGGRLSRQELGGATALSQATVSNLIGEMLEEGLVEEAGMVGSDGGRPRVLLRVAPGYGYVAGADVGETQVTVELYDLAMTRLGRCVYRLGDESDHRQATVLLMEGLCDVTAQAAVDSRDVLGYGVGVAGVVGHTGRDDLVYSQTTGWDGIPLGDLLGEATGVPAFVENGANAIGQAEMWFGAGRGARQAVVLLIGRGVGAAMVRDGRGHAALDDGAGEWGHTILRYDGELCRCGARGCLEAYIGSDAVSARLAAALGVDPDPGLMAAVLSGRVHSERATAILGETIGYLGAGVADLVNLYSPERIVLAGPIGALLGERYLDDVRAATARHALRYPYSRTRIDSCQLGPDSGAMGAASLPISRLLADGGVGDSDPSTVVSRAAHRRQLSRLRG